MLSESLVQIAVNNTVDIYCVGHVDTLPQPSIDVLSNPHIVRMGRAVQQDLKKKLSRNFRLVVIVDMMLEHFARKER